VKDVEVKVDDVVRCHATPCDVKDLEPGAHFVSASAAGLAAGAQRAFTVAPGERAAEHVALSSAERVHADLSVSGVGDGLRVFVDGRDLGAPPIAIRDIEPDTHVVRVTGPGRSYEPYEETVRLEPGESRSLGPVRLKLIRGRLELLPGDGSEGATVIVDGRHVPHLPATVELAADQAHEVIAQRRGFADFSEEVVFDNVAKRSLEVTLSPAQGSGATSHVRSSSDPSRISSNRSVSSSSSTAGMATLDVVSTPPSNVVVNGRPLGSTPLRSVKVPAGPQTVVFVHPSLGRKVASTAVAAGGHGTVSVKF
jgi:serine/threonine-protein kinase